MPTLDMEQQFVSRGITELFGEQKTISYSKIEHETIFKKMKIFKWPFIWSKSSCFGYSTNPKNTTANHTFAPYYIRNTHDRSIRLNTRRQVRIVTDTSIRYNLTMPFEHQIIFRHYTFSLFVPSKIINILDNMFLTPIFDINTKNNVSHPYSHNSTCVHCYQEIIKTYWILKERICGMCLPILQKSIKFKFSERCVAAQYNRVFLLSYYYGCRSCDILYPVGFDASIELKQIIQICIAEKIRYFNLSPYIVIPSDMQF